MDIVSYFIEDKALFGPYPEQREVKELEQLNVRHFVDLTNYDEMPYEYITSYTYTKYAIPDTKTPSNIITFTKFILNLEVSIRELKNSEKIYIHCKGGHGRACMVVAILLVRLFGLTPEEAMKKTSFYHKQRVNMKEKWRHTLCPNGKNQRFFVSTIFKQIYISKKYAQAVGFGKDSNHSVEIPGLGLFSSSEAAYQAYKALDNHQYIISQKLAIKPSESKIIAKGIDVRSDWSQIKEDVLYKVMLYKFIQNPSIQYKLLITSFKQIVKYDTKTVSTLCKILIKVRETLYKSQSIRELEDLGTEIYRGRAP